MWSFFNQLLGSMLPDGSSGIEDIPTGRSAGRSEGRGWESITWLSTENLVVSTRSTRRTGSILALGPATGTRETGVSPVAVFTKSPAGPRLRKKLLRRLLAPKIKGLRVGRDHHHREERPPALAQDRPGGGVSFEDADEPRGRTLRNGGVTCSPLSEGCGCHGHRTARREPVR